MNSGYHADQMVLLCYVITHNRQWFKIAVSLTTIMGFTWIVGVLVFNMALISFAYLFTIFVAFQVSHSEVTLDRILKSCYVFVVGFGHFHSICLLFKASELEE